MSQLDRIDSKILFELDRNSRASFTTIAKATRVSAETVRYRLARLEEQGVISKYHTVIDLGLIGFFVHKLYFKLSGADEKQIAEMIRFLGEIPEVVWIVRFEGQFDFALGYRSSSMFELSTFFDQFFRRYGKFIVRRGFCVNIRAEYLSRSYLVEDEKRDKLAMLYSAPGEPFTLDEMNRHILAELSVDSRLSAADIAASFKRRGSTRSTLSREAVLKRIKKLEQRKVISGYRILLDGQKLNQLICRVLLFLNPLPEDQIEKLISRLKVEPRAVYVCKVMGEWDYEWVLEVENLAQYRAIVADVTSDFPHAVRDFHGLIVNTLPKFYFAQGL